MIVTNQTTALATYDLRDIKPPVEIPTGWEWLWWVLAALVLAAGLWWAWRWWQRRQAKISIVPPVPAHVRARQKLRDALLFIAQPKTFCIAVSDAIRGYLEERFEFHAPEQTTEEFLYELQGTDLLVAEQKEKLGEFLASCDLVKFAKYEPGETELRDLYGSAMRLVDETVPQTLPAQEPEQVAANNVSEPGTESNMTNSLTSAEPRTDNSSKGKTLAVIGTLLQLGPSVWIIAYLVLLFRLLILAKEVTQSIPSKGFGVITELYSKMISIYGDALLLVCIGLMAGVVGLVLLTISLVSSRYRSEWFFWFLIIYGVLLLGAFPCFGTAVGIFFIVYCLTKRREFFYRT